MAIIKVAAGLLLLSVVVAVIDGKNLGRYERSVKKAVCSANYTISYCDKCVNPDLQCHVCPRGRILSRDRKACIDCPVGCKVCVETTASGTTDYRTECQKCIRRWKLQNDKTCGACGSYCDSCEVNGVTKCDVDRCNSTGLTTAVVYSNESLSCVPCAAYCLECVIKGAGKCDVGKCPARMVHDIDTLTCRSCGAHCQKCTTNGANKCDSGSCDTRYVIDSTLTCRACDPACTTCTTNGAGKCDGQSFCASNTFYDISSQTCKACGSHCDPCTLR